MCPISTVPYMNREPVQMMVMGCAFSCLDPVLSVVTALDYKTPFYITNKASYTSDPVRCRITVNEANFFLNVDSQKGISSSVVDPDSVSFLEKFGSGSVQNPIQEHKPYLAQFFKKKTL